MVFFRSQNDINDAQQKELMQRLGELTGKPSTSKLHIHPIYPVSEEARRYSGNDDEISVINSAAKKQVQAAHKSSLAPTSTSDIKQSMLSEWHSDISFENIPSDYAMLRLTKVPATGGGE